MIRGANAKCKGVAMLEMAGVMAVLLTLLICTIGLSVYLSAAYFTNHSLDKFLVDDGLPALTMSAGGLVEVDEAAMQKYVDDLADKIEAELKGANLDGSSGETGEDRYLIEASYVEANIDPSTGEFLSFEPSTFPYPLKYQSVRGSLQISSEIDSKYDLKKLYEHSAKQELFVLPTAGFDESGVDNFFSKGVLVGARVFYYSKAGLTKFVIQDLLGMEPVIGDFKVISPRTQIK